MQNDHTKYQFQTEEKNELLEKMTPIIEHALLQTHPRNREDLRQHLYELMIKTLNNVRFSEPGGLFRRK
ncbi:hypothetical protein D1B33_11835 [Lysinibacillus yapensis]|uniref:Uncharacterized protein n=1 Tax=Ureibacillus yapensis TaxID=2304605 RepID=A0A396S5L0_9BACL|nr:hypothetical protein [Lysinibacillus yapensis]RHW35790.1 hypothetical protein D1B33_11835 [Lysinibacillus yapensis]